MIKNGKKWDRKVHRRLGRAPMQQVYANKETHYYKREEIMQNQNNLETINFVNKFKSSSSAKNCFRKYRKCALNLKTKTFFKNTITHMKFVRRKITFGEHMCCVM